MVVGDGKVMWASKKDAKGALAQAGIEIVEKTEIVGIGEDLRNWVGILEGERLFVKYSTLQSIRPLLFLGPLYQALFQSKISIPTRFFYRPRRTTYSSTPRLIKSNQNRAPKHIPSPKSNVPRIDHQNKTSSLLRRAIYCATFIQIRIPSQKFSNQASGEIQRRKRSSRMASPPWCSSVGRRRENQESGSRTNTPRSNHQPYSQEQFPNQDQNQKRKEDRRSQPKPRPSSSSSPSSFRTFPTSTSISPTNLATNMGPKNHNANLTPLPPSTNIRFLTLLLLLLNLLDRNPKASPLLRRRVLQARNRNHRSNRRGQKCIWEESGKAGVCEGGGGLVEEGD